MVNINQNPIILWFRRDLRLSDNPALMAAVKSGRPVMPVYILDDDTGRPLGAAARWWLYHSLAALDQALQKVGSKLILRCGSSTTVLSSLIAETKAAGVYWNRLYDAESRIRDQAIKQSLKDQGRDGQSFNAALMWEPWEVTTKDGNAYRVFTPFWKELLRRAPPAAALRAPKQIPAPARWPKSDKLLDWALLPTKPDWAAAFADHWTPGEAGAAARLDGFLSDRLADYEKMRNRPDHDGTSGLSPHLAMGDISPRQIWQRTESFAAAHKGHEGAAISFLRELAWREFSYHLLYHFPELATRNWNNRFDGFPWRKDTKSLRAWQRGQTGYPIVDAGMRELWTTGFMHNRVRMIAASFLIKHLLIHWAEGERWFWDTLVDADPANNPASWQWVAGSGADATPYFRIFNPVLQGEKFDPAGSYVRHWLPELAKMPDKYIHQPWAAPADILKNAGVVLGKDYPKPLVDHGAARNRALLAYDKIKG